MSLLFCLPSISSCWPEQNFDTHRVIRSILITIPTRSLITVQTDERCWQVSLEFHLHSWALSNTGVHHSGVNMYPLRPIQAEIRQILQPRSAWTNVTQKNPNYSKGYIKIRCWSNCLSLLFYNSIRNKRKSITSVRIQETHTLLRGIGLSE